MSIPKPFKKSSYLVKKELAKNWYLADRMAVNLEEHLNEARTELANCRLRVQNLRLLIEQGERWNQRFESFVNGIAVSVHRRGISETLRAIINPAPSETFTTTQIRLILKDQDYDTTPRNFHSSLSTALTRLGWVRHDHDGCRWHADSHQERNDDINKGDCRTRGASGFRRYGQKVRHTARRG